MNPNTLVVKNHGRRPSENFDRAKLQHSVASACMAVRSSVGQAERVAKIVTDEVIAWLHDKPEVTSDDLRKITSQNLKRYNPDAAYLYINHLTTL